MMKKPAELEEALFKAVFDDDETAIEKLLGDGADPNYDSISGKTPLCHACALNKIKAVKILLRHGADPNKRFTFKSQVDGRIEQDMVALHYAASSETVSALLKAGADVHAVDASGTTALMRAAFHGNIGAVKALLAAGASPFARQQKVQGKKARTARELVESRIELWKEIKNESIQQKFEEIRHLLLDAEQDGIPVNV